MNFAAFVRTSLHEDDGKGAAAVQLHAEVIEALVLLLMKAVCTKYAQRK
jgi:hypothetical protein